MTFANTILIVDDTPENLYVLGDLLEQHGFEVRVAANGPEALENATANPPPDLILLDIMMPDMDGYEVCRRLKAEERSRTIPVIFITALTETVEKVKGLKVGGLDYITKPFAAEEVLARVGVHLRLRELTERLEEKVRERTVELEHEIKERRKAQDALQAQTNELLVTEEMLRVQIAEYENSQNQLQQAQKMEAVGRLAGGVAHDFNNMLTIIFGHTQLALMEADLSPKLHEHLSTIQSAAGKSADLTRHLLAFARKQIIAPIVLDLNEAVSGMLKMLQRLIGEDIHLVWKQGVPLWPVMIDPTQIDQILANLCVNARDAITDSGTITIETVNITIDKEYADQMDFLPGDYVKLVLSDNGIGMNKNVLAHIFEPFYTTKGVGKGTGLGLATVFGIVKQNNGYINVYSESGVGTTFTIYLPRYGEEIEEMQKEAVTDPVFCGRETILLVEDEAAIMKMTGMFLETRGYSVLMANSPHEALHLAKEHVGEINLLITDVVMPEMNGKELSLRLKTLRPTLKCLFMSGYTAEAIAQHGVLDDCIHFIQKPFSLDAIAKKTREVLDGN
jgi:DNA-binding response OmpR family regulator